MEPQAEKLMAESLDKNMIDKDEYPFTAMIEERCINIVTRLFNAPENFIRLGPAGYKRAFEQMRDTATYLSTAIEKTERFDLLSRGDTIPVFAFALKDSSHYTVYDLSDKLREHGWQVPGYTMPPKVDDLAVLPIVVREGFSRDLADMLMKDLKAAIQHFESQPGYQAKKPKKTGRVHKNC